MRRFPQRSSAMIVLLCCLAAMFAGGCAAPEGNQAAGFRMPGTGAISPLPGYSRTSANTSQQPDVQQTALSASQQASADQQPVAQVGFFNHARTTPGCLGGSAAGACGCNSCGTTACSPAPYGCVVQTPAGWNAYGIDPQEFICDGGDQPPHVVLRRDDTLGGLNPEDTVVHYTTEAGDIGIQASNRTCLYAPRFSSVRKITGALAGDFAIGAAQVDRPQGANRVDVNLPGLVMSDTVELGHADAARHIDAMRDRNRGVPVEGLQQPEQAGEVLAALVGLTVADLNELRDDEKALFEQLALSAVAWTLDEALEVAIEDLKPPTLTRDQELQGLTIYEFPDAGRLQISKLADRSDALPGEIVNFAIRVQNVGDSPVNHVVLTDNLTTRLQYVDGSQTCTGGAEFEATANQALSLKLQWKLTDELRVGESVTIRFQCKLR